MGRLELWGMPSGIEYIEVSSVNTRGLQDIIKCKDVLHYLDKNCNSNIICLQDTHWTNNDLRKINAIWNNPLYINGQKSNARGVAILFKSNFEFKILETYADDLGNLIQLDILIENEFTLRLINIYAPNNDDPNFFKNLEKLIAENLCNYLLICGDFNLVLDPKTDTKNYKNINNPKARDTLLGLINNFDLIDIFRQMHPEKLSYTWTRKKPMQMARLDFFLTNNAFSDLINKSSIKPGYRTDHSRIELKIAFNQFEKGKSTWKFNCDLLKNSDYLKTINELIEEEKKRYLIPNEYNDVLEDCDLVFNISDQLFLETLLLRIRGETIKFSSRLKRMQYDKEQSLLKEIELLNDQNLTNDQYYILEEKKSELEKIRHTKLKGEIIRSRVQLLCDGEKPSKYFCALENYNYLNKTIKRITTSNGKIITNQTEILKEIRTFYKDLYSNKDHLLAFPDIIELGDSLKLPKLTAKKSQHMEGALTLSELSNSLMKMKNNKSPGSDGFPADFFKVFWSRLKYFVLRSLNEAFSKKELSVTMRQVILTCLPKGSKPRHLLKNWRPISLLNVTYKLGSASIANRLQQICNDIISPTHTESIYW